MIYGLRVQEIDHVGKVSFGQRSRKLVVICHSLHDRFSSSKLAVCTKKEDHYNYFLNLFLFR